MPLIDKHNLNGWTRPSAFESLLNDFPDMESTIRRNLRITSRSVNIRLKQIAEVKTNRNYDQMTRNFLEQYLKAELERTEFYKRWRWLKKFSDYIKRRALGIVGLPIEQARATPILSLHEFQKVRRIGKRTMCSCPFHQDDTPSFIIYPTNTFYCFSCHIGGSSIDFIMKLHNLSFRDAVNYLVKHG